MQSDQSPPKSGKIAFRYGLIFGIGLFVIAAILFSLGTFLFFNSDFSIVFSLIYWLIGLVAFFLGGMFAAQKTGKVSTGTIAGLWAGIFDGALYAILAIIVFFTYSLSRLPADTLGTSSSAAGISTETAQQLVVATAVVGQILALLIAIGLGAGIGALGGLVGRATSKVPKQLYPGQPYPGQPYPGQPYPGQPYPGQPYPGQPYPGQPNSGQPYPGQPYPGQPYPGQPNSGQPYPGQPYPSPAQPSQPENSPMLQVGPSDAAEQDQTKKSDRPSNMYNSYLEAQESHPSSPADTAPQADQSQHP